MTQARWLSMLAVISFAGLMLFVRPIPQPEEYHNFADQRELLHGIPNTLNVLSNVPFVLIGTAGLLLMRRNLSFASRQERIDAIIFFGGTILTGIGSAIYHWRPDDASLVYDRLGITVAFMAFLAMIVHSRVADAKWLLPVLIAIGAASVFWWRAANDLRPYGWVQFFPLLAIAAILMTGRRRYSGEASAIAAMFVAYAAAKLFEYYDRQIDFAAGGVISGHTLKHLAAAVALLIAIVWIARRREPN